MTTEELSKQFYEKQEELEKTRSNLSILNSIDIWIFGVVIGLVISLITIPGQTSLAFNATYLMFNLAWLTCSFLKIRWNNKIHRLKSEQFKIIDQAIEQEETSNAE